VTSTSRTLITVSNSVLAAVVDGVPLSDTERRELLASVGLTAEAVRDVHARSSILVFARLWRRLRRLTGDDFAGLTVGASVRGEQFGLAVHAAQHGDELFREGLVAFTKYTSLATNLLECTLEEAPPLARFVTRLHWDLFRLDRHAADIAFAALTKWAHDHLAVPMVVRQVRLVHTLASARARYERTFGAPIVFGARRNELIFDSAILDAPISRRDPELGRLLGHYASQELLRIPVVTDLPSRFTQIVRRRLEEGESIDATSIAGELGISVRSMQRRLWQHGTSSSALIEQTRRSLAPALLAESDSNVVQVSLRLGYSEPTAFIRAFKKWYGVTPGLYRRARSA
jgi:AraC-like DNA-binding protein